MVCWLIIMICTEYKKMCGIIIEVGPHSIKLFYLLFTLINDYYRLMVRISDGVSLSNSIIKTPVLELMLQGYEWFPNLNMNTYTNSFSKMRVDLAAHLPHLIYM